MPHPSHLLVRSAFAFAAAGLLTLVPAAAESLLPAEPIRLDSLAAFKAPGANWRLASGLAGDPRREQSLVAEDGSGVLVNQPRDDARANLLTVAEHGDVDLDLDFLVPAGSDSGVYLMGRYEVQILDSWRKAKVDASDCGGIHPREDPARGAGDEGSAGRAPRANASRAPGLWQHLHIEFRAPRFDADGKKTANARFVRVVLNGFTVQEDVEVAGPTRAAAFLGEAPRGPLMLQGDHGPVAFRRLAWRDYDPAAEPVRVEGLAARVTVIDQETDERQPPQDVEVDAITYAPFGKFGRCEIEITGRLQVPRAGVYAFAAPGAGGLRLAVDGRRAIAGSEGFNETVPLLLTAGAHEFRLTGRRHGWENSSRLRLTVEGPGLAPQDLADPAPTGGRAPGTLPIEPEGGRVRLQRGFVPFQPVKRLYAINVGTPAGVHFAYDTETGAILRAWRGGFLDTYDMWHERGYSQLAKPTGPDLTLPNLPVLALMEWAGNDWPTEPDAMRTFSGYKLEADGLPVFNFTLAGLATTDRIAPAADGAGVTRTLTVTGRTASWEAWVLLAAADRITPQPGGGYIVGDREYYLDLPPDPPVPPLLIGRGGQQHLVFPVSPATLGRPLTFTLVW